MNYPKFILTADGFLRLGMVTLHRHLIENGDVCLGGGYWHINHAARQVELSGSSSDYGAPQWHRIDSVKLPGDYKGYSFAWLINGKQHPLTEMLLVEYV